MSDVQVDLSPERIRQLPDWAQAAFAARNALRVLPLFSPPAGKSGEDADQIRAAIACALIALRSAIEPELKYDAAVAPALNVLSGDVPGPFAAARDAIAGAARATLARQAGKQEALASAVVSAFQAAQTAAAAYGPPELFIAPAIDDVSSLESDTPSRDTLLAFFTRPLFRSDITPDRGPAAVKEWGDRLESLAMRDVRDLYVRIHGGSITDADLQSMDVWIHNYESRVAHHPSATAAESAATTAAPATEQGAPAAVHSGPPDVWMVSDRPLDGDFEAQDRFNFKDYAEALATILDHRKTETPFTMAINAPWGTGKTSLAKMIEARLKRRPKDRGDAPHITCWFNAWMHDDAKNLASAFIAQVSREADRERRWTTWLFDNMPASLLHPRHVLWRRLTYGTVSIVAAGLVTWQLALHLEHVKAIKDYAAESTQAHQITETTISDGSGTVTTGRSTSDTKTQAVAVTPATQKPEATWLDGTLLWFDREQVLLGSFLTAFTAFGAALWKLLSTASLGRFVDSPDKAAESGTIESARRHLGTLIEQATWRGNRFVVFVDDIERCTPPRSVDVLEAINQLMDHPGAIVVLLGDMATVAAAAQLKYKDLAATLVPSSGVSAVGPERGKEVFGRLYLQKIVQFQFDLPIPPRDTIQAYMSGMAGSE
jgi:Cdc6-like AAA superfamily ATPase